ncbi:hypothetical protein HDU80_001363, partial [Chytriomyces hyalinus]
NLVDYAGAAAIHVNDAGETDENLVDHAGAAAIHVNDAGETDENLVDHAGATATHVNDAGETDENLVDHAGTAGDSDENLVDDAGNAGDSDENLVDLIWDNDLPSSDNDSDFSLRTHVLSEEEPSNADDSDLEEDPEPDAKADEGWEFTVSSDKFMKGTHAPFKSNVEFRLLSLFTTLGAGRFSRSQQSDILDVYDDILGTLTLGRLRSLSSDIRELLNVSPSLIEIGTKQVHYIPIQKTIRLAFANPLICSQLHTLPTLHAITSELFHASKWIDEIATPMVRMQQTNGFLDIFAGEVYHSGQGEGINRGWKHTCMREKAMLKNGCLTVHDDDILVFASSIPSAVNVDMVTTFHFGQDIPEYLIRTVKSCSPLRTKAKGRQVFNVPLTLFNNDTSGNVSKNGTTRNASAIETAEIIVRCMRELRDGIDVYDVTLNESVLVTGGTSAETPFIVGPLDTPVEILHCVLLGLVKYFMRATIDGLTVEKKDILKACLEGVRQDRFPAKIVGQTFVKYAHSLNGKDFRLFVQAAPFALQNVVTRELLDTWVALSHLVAHLYMSHIDVTGYNLDFTKYMDQFVYQRHLKAQTKSFAAA